MSAEHNFANTKQEHTFEKPEPPCWALTASVTVHLY